MNHQFNFLDLVGVILVSVAILFLFMLMREIYYKLLFIRMRKKREKEWEKISCIPIVPGSTEDWEKEWVLISDSNSNLTEWKKDTNFCLRPVSHRDLLSGLSSSWLDQMLLRPELIPAEWIRKGICFWGTFYERRDFPGHSYVRVLEFNGMIWVWNFKWVGSKRIDKKHFIISLL